LLPPLSSTVQALASVHFSRKEKYLKGRGRESESGWEWEVGERGGCVCEGAGGGREGERREEEMRWGEVEKKYEIIWEDRVYIEKQGEWRYGKWKKEGSTNDHQITTWLSLYLLVSYFSNFE
jgi:hypothetical protein